MHGIPLNKHKIVRKTLHLMDEISCSRIDYDIARKSDNGEPITIRLSPEYMYLILRYIPYTHIYEAIIDPTIRDAIIADQVNVLMAHMLHELPGAAFDVLGRRQFISRPLKSAVIDAVTMMIQKNKNRVTHDNLEKFEHRLHNGFMLDMC